MTHHSLLKKTEKKYAKEKYLTVGMFIDNKYNKLQNKFKKDLIMKRGWVNGSWVTRKHNAIGLMCGKKYGLFVLDIDDMKVWEAILNEYADGKEPQTVKAISGNNGAHYYFKYEDRLDEIKSRDKAVTYGGKQVDIDTRGDGNMIICPPSKYYNQNVLTEVHYRWERELLVSPLETMPDWLYKLLVTSDGAIKKIIHDTSPEKN